MRSLVLIFFVFSFHFASAVSMEVIGLEGEVLFSKKSEIQLPSTVGKVSVEIFDENEVPYDGNEIGMHSIYDLEQEIDIISKKEMKAYGWCFSINGKVPETLTDTTPVLDQGDEIVWFYAYAHYLAGDWIGQCVTDYDIKE